MTPCTVPGAAISRVMLAIDLDRLSDEATVRPVCDDWAWYVQYSTERLPHPLSFA